MEFYPPPTPLSWKNTNEFSQKPFPACAVTLYKQIAKLIVRRYDMPLLLVLKKSCFHKVNCTELACLFVENRYS